MKQLVSILIFTFGYFISSISCQSVCRVDSATPITPPTIWSIDVRGKFPEGIGENETEGTEIWNSGLSSPMRFENSSRPSVLEFSSDTSEFIIRTGLEFTDIVDKIKDEILTVTVFFTCAEDNVLLEFRLIVLVVPVNSQPPVFSTSELNYAITTPWNPNVPLNYKDIVTVTDADYPVGEELTLEISDSRFRTDFNANTSELTLFSTISRFPTDEISFVVTANDGVHEATLVVNIFVTNKENLLAPKFEENFYYVDEIDPNEEELFIVEIEATDPDNQYSIEYKVPVEYETYIRLGGVNGNRVYFRTSIPPDFPFIFEITAIEAEETNPLSTNVAVIVNYPDEQVVFRETMYTFNDIAISLEQNDLIRDTPIDVLPGFQITLESQYFGITDDYKIFVKQDLEEADIFTDENPNGVHVGILKSGSQQAVLLVYFDPTLREGGTTPGCATTVDAGDCECTTMTAVTDPCPSTAVTCECENECTTPSTEPCPSTAGSCECDNECTTIVTNPSDCSSTPSTFETCSPPTPCDCNSTTTADTTTTCPTIPCDNDCTTPPPDAECPPPDSCDNCDSGSSQTGLVVGIAVVSVVAAGAIGAAVYFYMRSARLSRDTTSSYYNNNTTTDDFGQDTAQKAVSGFNNPIFANTSSFGTSSDKIPLVKETKYNDVLDKVKVVPASSNAVGSSSNYASPSTVSFGNIDNSSNNNDNNAEKSSAGEYGSNKDALKSSLAQPKEIPADYDGADEIETGTEKAPKKEKKILFVGEQVIPIEKGGSNESNTVKDDLEPPPMSDSEMEDNPDEKL